MTLGATIEARMGSTRLPGKMLTEVVPGVTLLDAVFRRAREAECLESLAVITSTNANDDVIAAHCEAKGYPVFRGSEDDVLNRVTSACRHFGLSDHVRLTGDNPLIDGHLIDAVAKYYREGGFDLVTTTHMCHTENWSAERTFPRGVSIMVSRVACLEESERLSADPLDHENVGFFIYSHPDRYRLGAFLAENDFARWRHPELRMTVDTPQDLELIRQIFGRLGKGGPETFSTGEAIALVASDPDLGRINAEVPQKIVSQLKAESARES